VAGLTPSRTRPDDEEQAGAPRWHNLAIAALIALILSPLVFFPPFRLVEERLYDVFSTLSPLRPAQPGVTIVAIDEPSFSEIGQRWPWSRELHAQVVRNLREAGAKVVALDIIFAEPSTPQADEALAQAAGPNVVFAADDVTTVMEQATQVTRVMPIDMLLSGGATAGFTSVFLDGDAYLRRMPTMPDSFAAQTLRAAGLSFATPPPGGLIQYLGPPNSYPRVSYYQALDPAQFLPPGFFRDKIVFVGLSLKAAATPDSGAADTFLTPYTLSSEAVTAGVEVQATILDNLRHGLFIEPISRPLTIAILIAAALLAAALCGSGMSKRSVLRAVIAVLALTIGAWALLRFGRIWAPPALPLGAMIGVFGSRFGLDYSRERRLRRSVSEAFSRYLSPDLVKQLAQNPAALKLGGERRNLTVLFCDVRGFTTLSERLKDEPERLTALINRLLDPLSEAVLAEGGTIDKYMGDCVMAFWNAPLPTTDHPRRAVDAALRMIDAVAVLNRVLREESSDAPRFAVGVGINTGDCVVGNVGSRWRYDYSVLGDTVNLASRLEGLSKEYGVSIILGEGTAAAVAQDYVLLELDRIAVRGRTTQSAIFTVLGPVSMRADEAVARLEVDHAQLMQALHDGRFDEAEALLDLSEGHSLSLAKFYQRLRRILIERAAATT
jgi:adenylate cyclase